ncbi:MAG: glycosyltransferase [Candidatus Dormibacteraeota bacterium]|nr:glycosyltransferase [Candidatus Dormibacteraeota bacterium]
MPVSDSNRRLRKALSRKLERMIDRGVAARSEAITAALRALAADLAATTEHIGELGEAIDVLGEKARDLRAITAAMLDDVPHLRAELAAARLSEAYERALTDAEPLVSIRIPTYVRARLLVERALPSIVRQTYQHFEVIVVGDGCSNDTAQRIEAFGDPRVRFVNLPYRHPYPEDANDRWQIAGAAAVNAATTLAKGSWLALLGDDDEMDPHHLEWLLDAARSSRSEMAYGDILERNPNPADDRVLGGFPPRHGFFNFQAAMVMSALRAFEFSTTSWVLDEPSDWNLCRRMLEAGVRMKYVNRVVEIHYPSRLYTADQAG